MLISIYKARKKYFKEIKLDPKLSREAVNKIRFDIKSKLSPVKEVFDCSKKIFTQKGDSVSNINIGKKLFDELNFISHCLKEEKLQLNL
ncbi:hypothetical protein [Borreliella americana]|uniref:hypothetical protein n=1 Tax=Borreliella americana TaxID=478807 RepID=UPI001E2AD239|nr:hypothetical protein [Borreliella americana]MCD2332639.1 hypothetical protein [Borreliella americana]